ncbi:hypothetical protein OEZ86_013548 [Tetradesmus obliquus]|nr:hypothetical protein OEZ86_013548 [Tetradesmus obliquus]
MTSEKAMLFYMADSRSSHAPCALVCVNCAQADQPWQECKLDMVHKLIWDGDVKGQGAVQAAQSRSDAGAPACRAASGLQYVHKQSQAVPVDRLLVFEVSQGWGPLCKFLGKPVPQQPFPHINDREEWRQRLQHIRRLNAALTYGIPAVAVALAAAGVAMGRLWLQRSQSS